MGYSFNNAKLMEISDGSYLINMGMCIPVLGKSVTIEKRFT